MTIHIRAISGIGGKEPACFLVEVGGKRLLLDLGEGPDRAQRPDLGCLGLIDGVLLSHAHPDHAGALDWLGKIGNPRCSRQPSMDDVDTACHAARAPMVSDDSRNAKLHGIGTSR